jgi:hypothetical protein
MPNELTRAVSDEHIAASVRQAEELLKNIHLSESEQTWAKKQATAIFKTVTDALLDSGEAFGQLSMVCAPAAIAYALSIAHDWSIKSRELASHGNDNDGYR